MSGKDFKSGFQKLKQTGKTTHTEMTTHVPKVKKRMGRPTTKDPNTEYVRVSVDMPRDMRADLKTLLYTKFRGKYPSQNDLILDILRNFIENND
jgi:hypothetical protein